jgi:hypothetical protein
MNRKVPDDVKETKEFTLRQLWNEPTPIPDAPTPIPETTYRVQIPSAPTQQEIDEHFGRNKISFKRRV